MSPQFTTIIFSWVTWDSLSTMSNTKKTQRIPRKLIKILSESYAMDWEEPLKIPPKSTKVWKKLSKSIWETTSSAFTRLRPHKKESRKQSYRLTKEFNPSKDHMKKSETYKSCTRKMIYLNAYIIQLVFKIISQIISCILKVIYQTKCSVETILFPAFKKNSLTIHNKRVDVLALSLKRDHQRFDEVFSFAKRHIQHQRLVNTIETEDLFIFVWLESLHKWQILI